MSITVRKYGENDINGMISVWNEVVRDGVAFPQTEELDFESGKKFFAEQTCCPVATDENGEVLGMYILHPNNVGRCGHICNQAMRFPHRQGEKVSAESLCRIALSVLKNTASKFCSSMLL